MDFRLIELPLCVKEAQSDLGKTNKGTNQLQGKRANQKLRRGEREALSSPKTATQPKRTTVTSHIPMPIPANSGGIFQRHYHHLEALTPLYKTQPRITFINHHMWQGEATKSCESKLCLATLFIFPANRQSYGRRHHLGFVTHHPRSKSRPALTPLDHHRRQIDVGKF